MCSEKYVKKKKSPIRFCLSPVTASEYCRFADSCVNVNPARTIQTVFASSSNHCVVHFHRSDSQNTETAPAYTEGIAIFLMCGFISLLIIC